MFSVTLKPNKYDPRTGMNYFLTKSTINIYYVNAAAQIDTFLVTYWEVLQLIQTRSRF